jgi:putative endonuclease
VVQGRNKKWELSSAGSEHLPYKQRVGGSNPSAPTQKPPIKLGGFFMPAFFYILFSTRKNRFYVGHTTEPLDERVRKHNSNHKGYTGTTHDWVLAYFETYPNKCDAYARELAVKKWKSRSRIERLIQSIPL